MVPIEQNKQLNKYYDSSHSFLSLFSLFSAICKQAITTGAHTDRMEDTIVGSGTKQYNGVDGKEENHLYILSGTFGARFGVTKAHSMPEPDPEPPRERRFDFSLSNFLAKCKKVSFIVGFLHFILTLLP